MAAVTLQARLLRWGNSLGVRISKKDADRLGLVPGSDVVIHIDEPAAPIDLGHIRFIDDPAARRPFADVREEYYGDRAGRLGGHAREAEDAHR